METTLEKLVFLGFHTTTIAQTVTSLQRTFSTMFVNKHYFALAEGVQCLRLGGCVNATRLPRTPMVVRVHKGISSNLFVDNRAYREFLNSKFNATAIDMETAAVARSVTNRRCLLLHLDPCPI
ncbi:hypothetical protein REPUB_Repub18cG0095500 [Reevesia pubescens]